MVEIVGRIVLHADALHDADRAAVGGHREGDDLLQTQSGEAGIERSLGAFGGVTLAPMRAGEAPADLHRRREVRIEPRDREADKADERRDARHLDRPPAEPVLREMSLDARDESIDVRAGRGGQELHDARVVEHGDEGLVVRVAPGAQEQARGGNGRRGHVSALAAPMVQLHHSTKRFPPEAGLPPRSRQGL